MQKVDIDSDHDEPVPEPPPEAAVAVPSAVAVPAESPIEKWTVKGPRLMWKEADLAGKATVAAPAADELPGDAEVPAVPPLPWPWWDFAVHGIREYADLPNVRGNALIVVMRKRSDGVVADMGAFAVPGRDQT